MKPRFFSVVMTTYNRAPLLKRALLSLIAQSESDWEAIIIDDGSSDNTEAFIQEYLTQYSDKIRYVKQDNQGTVKAKNAGLALATGTFITFLDSDDEYRPEHLKIRKTLLEQHPEVEFLYGGIELIGNEYVPDRNNHEKLIHLSECVIGGTFFVKRTVMLSLKGFRYFPIGTDADLFERVNASGVPVMKTNFTTYVYRRETEDSITHQFSAKPVQSDWV